MYSIPDRLETEITRQLNIRYPIVAAPMFLVSSPELLIAVYRAGGIGVIPTLNFRTAEAYRAFLRDFPSDVAFGVNLILHGNPRLEEDLAATVERRVPLVVTSLGDPTEVVSAVHAYGGRVWCDVIGRRHAEKAALAGADALVAVAAGAGGHAGRISPLVLAPWLKRITRLPVLVAGGIATGRGLLAALALGDGAYIGTRFLATRESAAPDAYKRALLEASPEEIEYTEEVTGVAGNFLRRSLERFRAGGARAWKEVWSAGHGVAFIDDLPSAAELMERLLREYVLARAELP